MTYPRWRDLSGGDLEVFRGSTAFLKGRLTEASTLLWALKIQPADIARRVAVLASIDEAIEKGELQEPWASAWSLVGEAWEDPTPIPNVQHLDAFRALERVKRGDRSGTLVREIVNLVRPRLSIASARRLDLRGSRWKPKVQTDLVHPSLTSGELQPPTRLGLNRVEDADFLRQLARSLDAVVHEGLEIARRFGWKGENLYGLGGLDRVENVPFGEDNDRDSTDQFHEGIAPSVKLLHGVVTILADRDLDAAREIIDGFRRAGTIVHSRLWMSFAREARFASIDQVANDLHAMGDREFWSLHGFPEMSALRAARFDELSDEDTTKVVLRLLRGPPRNFWPRSSDKDRVEGARDYWVTRELRRIQNVGGHLSATAEDWLAEHLPEFADLAASTRPDEGFPGAVDIFDVPQGSDNTYDQLDGLGRLQRLERDLNTKGVGWGAGPAESASSWIGRTPNALALVDSLERLPPEDRRFPEVWERMGWHHRAQAEPGEEARDFLSEGFRVLNLIASLDDKTIEGAADGLSYWLSNWGQYVAEAPTFLEVWLRVWPPAVALTNAQQREDEVPRLDVVVSGGNDAEPRDLDTYNTAVGRMVGAFLTMCPNLGAVADGAAFPDRAPQTQVRDILVGEAGRAGLIVRHRLIEHLGYFMRADRAWSEANLIPPLAAEDESALPLWNAMVRRPLAASVVQILAPFMLLRAVDPRLGRETRRSLAFRIVIECLVAHWEQRASAISSADAQRAIRAMTEEIRASAASTVQRFVDDFSGQENVTPEALFDEGVVPFLERDWPQERSLATPGVSKAFADLPITVGERFAVAVGAIERFLVPFDAWSMIDYGLYGNDAENVPLLAKINTREKAEAFLLLLDKTIGAAEGAVIPHDLSTALQQVRAIAPPLVDTPRYRRLATAARL
jgi:hypothetical protein